MLIVAVISCGLCFTQQSSNFILHATKPFIKYTMALEEVVNFDKINNNIKDTKFKKQKVKLEKNKRNKYFVSKLEYTKHLDDIEDKNDLYVIAEKYYIYLINVIDYYTFKFTKIYKEYCNNSKKMEKLEDFSTLLNDALQNKNILFIRNRKYEYISARLNALIDGFEILDDCITNSTYDNLSSDQLQKLQDGFINIINKHI